MTTPTAADYQQANAIPKGFSLIKVIVSRCTFKKKVQFTELQAKQWDTSIVSKPEKSMLPARIERSLRNPYQATKTHLGRYTLPYGGNLYLVSDENKDELIKLLEAEQFRMNTALTAILINYDALKEEHAQACDSNAHLPDGFGDIIREQAFSIGYIMEQVKYVIEPQVNLSEELGNGFISQIASEADDYANQLLDTAKHNDGKVRIINRSVDKMKDMRARLNAMRRLDKRIIPAIKLIDRWLNSLPSTGTSAENAQDLVALLGLLSKPELLTIEATVLEDDTVDNESADLLAPDTTEHQAMNQDETEARKEVYTFF